MMESSTSFCSNCCKTRAVEEFLMNRKGNLNEICIRHIKKRAIPFLGQWDEFTDEIKTWSQPG